MLPRFGVAVNTARADEQSEDDAWLIALLAEADLVIVAEFLLYLRLVHRLVGGGFHVDPVLKSRERERSARRGVARKRWKLKRSTRWPSFFPVLQQFSTECVMSD